MDKIQVNRSGAAETKRNPQDRARHIAKKGYEHELVFGHHA